jgi:hypothetical protein
VLIYPCWLDSVVSPLLSPYINLASCPCPCALSPPNRLFFCCCFLPLSTVISMLLSTCACYYRHRSVAVICAVFWHATLRRQPQVHGSSTRVDACPLEVRVRCNSTADTHMNSHISNTLVISCGFEKGYGKQYSHFRKLVGTVSNCLFTWLTALTDVSIDVTLLSE